MEMTIEMPLVETCTVNECAYNKNDMCHARAITIGDGIHPGCDTSFLGAPSRTRAKTLAGVGACKVTSCRFNNDLECDAESITVGMMRDTIQCTTHKAG